jgi:hypothetical protein
MCRLRNKAIPVNGEIAASIHKNAWRFLSNLIPGLFCYQPGKWKAVAGTTAGGGFNAPTDSGVGYRTATLDFAGL